MVITVFLLTTGGHVTTEKRSKSIGILAGLAAMGPKLWAIVKSLKYAKYLITLVSMLISVVAYGFAYGSWYFACGLVMLLLVHEYGHVIALRIKGIAAKAPVFIPFLGALIFAPLPDSKDDEAYVGFGGPLLGSFGALIPFALLFIFEDNERVRNICAVLSYVGFMLNLFNMIPARPLDGGRILHPLGGWVPYIGLIIVLSFAFIAQDIFLVFIAIVVVGDAKLIRPLLVFFLGAVFSAVVCAGSIMYLDLQSGFWPNAGMIAIAIGSGLFTPLLAWAMWSSRHKPLECRCDDNPAPLGVKFKWTVLYALLVITLFGLLEVSMSHLPGAAREHSLGKTFKEIVS